MASAALAVWVEVPVQEESRDSREILLEMMDLASVALEAWEALDRCPASVAWEDSIKTSSVAVWEISAAEASHLSRAFPLAEALHNQLRLRLSLRTARESLALRRPLSIVRVAKPLKLQMR